MNDKIEHKRKAAGAAGRPAWAHPRLTRLRAGSAEVGTRTVVQDGPLAESRS